MGNVVCNGTVCGFAQEIREEIAVIHSMVSNVRDRLTAFEGYLDRISTMVQITHRDMLDIRRVLRIIHPTEETGQPASVKEDNDFAKGTQQWRGKSNG